MSQTRLYKIQKKKHFNVKEIGFVQHKFKNYYNIQEWVHKAHNSILEGKTLLKKGCVIWHKQNYTFTFKQ